MDLEAIKRNPKIICSYSNGTTLLNVIHAQTGLVVYYGQFPGVFGDLSHYDYLHFKANFIDNTNDLLLFASRDEFRNRLEDNCLSSGGIWLLFGKSGGPKTIKVNEALEEALCFGWIDGQMQSIDDKKYIKYFSARRENSKWSEKNKTLDERLEKQGIMTDYIFNYIWVENKHLYIGNIKWLIFLSMENFYEKSICIESLK